MWNLFHQSTLKSPFQDELVGIMEAVTNKAKRAGKALTPASLYAFFVDQCRQNLHLVIAMSPGRFKLCLSVQIPILSRISEPLYPPCCLRH